MTISKSIKYFATEVSEDTENTVYYCFLCALCDLGGKKQLIVLCALIKVKL